MGETVFKSHSNKVRALKGGKVLAGFAGSVADALTLYEKFEEKLDRYPGQPPPRRGRAGQGLAQRPDSPAAGGTPGGGRPGAQLPPERVGRADRARDGIIAIGSGGNFALAAARALLPEPDRSAREIPSARWRSRPISVSSPTAISRFWNCRGREA